MNTQKILLLKLKSVWELLLGRLELILKPGFDRNYKYLIESIEAKEQEGKLISIVHYKLIGCRKLISESAVELNRLALFSLFRADHAQMIVSIATVEAFMNLPANEIIDKYVRYIEYCNLKLNGIKK